MKRSWFIVMVICMLFVFLIFPVSLLVVSSIVLGSWWPAFLIPVIIILSNRFIDRGYAWIANKFIKDQRKESSS